MAIITGTAGDDDLATTQDPSDTIDGGDGIDHLHGTFQHLTTGLTLVLDTTPGAVTTASSGTTLRHVEQLSLEGTAFDDTLGGGLFSDRLSGGAGDDRLDGAAGNDVLEGGGGDDRLAGGDGDDYLFDAEGSNVLIGGDGDDTLGSGAGVDIIDGGAGSDRWVVDFSSLSSGLTIAMDTTPGATTTASNGTTVRDVESVQIAGTAHDDIITGGVSNDTLLGDDGNDRLDGGDGDDQLVDDSGSNILLGRAGNDRLDGGAGLFDGGDGDDEIFTRGGIASVEGGAGNDLWSGTFASLATGLVLVMAANASDVSTASDGTTIVNAERVHITGSNFDDLIVGGSGNDVIQGGAGRDVLDGGAGNDVLIAGAGDTLRFSGTFGNDVVLTFNNDSYRLDLKAFTSYDLTQVGDDTIVTVAGGQITARGITPQELAPRIDIACLLRGTLVRTPDGDVPVETLAIGDPIITLDGAAKPLKWIGRHAYAPIVARLNPAIVPIRIAAGALGPAIPTIDLLVSAEHALYLDGALVPAKLLVNGTTICPAPEIARVEYFHLELDAPDVLWANGAPTETYVNHGNRRMFKNWTEYVDRYGAEDEAPRGADGQYVRRFKVIYGGAALQAIRSRLMPASAA